MTEKAWSKSVYSSNVAEVGYNPETQELLVTFNNGRSYVYEGVPEETAAALAVAPSVGTMLNTDIKGVYTFRKL